MPKPSPYFRSEEERKALLAARDSFKFDDDPLPNNLIMIAGEPGVGKTHLACTMIETGPVYLLDTEWRAGLVTRKFDKIKTAAVRTYADLVVGVKHIIKHQPKGTIVIDSMSDLQTYAEERYLEITQAEKIWPQWNWAQVYAMCNAIVDDIKFSGFNLVMTTKVKEQYVNDKASGVMIPKIYPAIPYKSDLVIQFKNRQPILTKNGFADDLNVQLSREMTLPQIIQKVSELE